MHGRNVTIRNCRPFCRAFVAIEIAASTPLRIDPIGLARALTANAMRRASPRAVRHTQQLAKNLSHPGPHAVAQAAEVVLALWLERKFSKDEILALYLNAFISAPRLWGRCRRAALFRQARQAGDTRPAAMPQASCGRRRALRHRNPNGAEMRGRPC